MQFLKLREANLPESVSEDTIIFTDLGNIYVSTKSGSLKLMGGTGTGGTGGTTVVNSGLPVVKALPASPTNEDSYILAIPNKVPKIISYLNDKWWQTPMVPFIDDTNIMLTLTGSGCAKMINPDALKPVGVMSFSAKVRPAYNTSYSYVVGSGAETSDRQRGICIVITSSSTIYVGAKNASRKCTTGYFSFTKADVLNIVGVFDTDNLYVYINGVLVKTQPAVNHSDYDVSTVPYGAHIGGPSSGTSNTFSGHMEHLAIYDRVLTQEDVTALLTQTPDTIAGVKHYWPLNDGSDTLTDIIAGEAATLTGTYSWTRK